MRIKKSRWKDQGPAHSVPRISRIERRSWPRDSDLFQREKHTPIFDFSANIDGISRDESLPRDLSAAGACHNRQQRRRTCGDTSDTLDTERGISSEPGEEQHTTEAGSHRGKLTASLTGVVYVRSYLRLSPVTLVFGSISVPLVSHDIANQGVYVFSILSLLR